MTVNVIYEREPCKKMKSTVKTILVYLAVITVIILFVSNFFSFTEVEPVRYDDVVEYFKNDQVKSFKVSNTNYLELEIYDLGENGEFIYDSDGKIINPIKKIGYKLQSLELFHSDLSQYYLNNENLEAYDFDPPTVWPWWISFLPYIIILIVFIALWFYALNQAASGRGSKISFFGKARVKMPGPNDKDRKTFKDVAGADEEKAELEEIVAYLKDSVKFSRLGAKFPRRVAGRPSGNRQDAVGQGSSWRGRGSLFLNIRLRLCRDVCRRRRLARA